MSDYPDTRDALYELIDGRTFAGRKAVAYYRITVDNQGRPAYLTMGPDEATVLLYTVGGTQGYIDRVDRATVEVYAPGTSAVEVAEAIAAEIAGDPALYGMGGKPHDLDAGYIDGISVEVTPHDVPFQSDLVNLARATYLVTSRPL